jgi:hypothetical protein
MLAFFVHAVSIPLAKCPVRLLGRLAKYPGTVSTSYHPVRTAPCPPKTERTSRWHLVSMVWDPGPLRIDPGSDALQAHGPSARWPQLWLWRIWLRWPWHWIQYRHRTRLLSRAYSAECDARCQSESRAFLLDRARCGRSTRIRVLHLDTKTLNNVYNMASAVAQVISQSDPEAGTALFDKLRSSSPYVRVTFGKAGVGMDSASVWRAGDNDRLKLLRFKRLDNARTDHEIAVEVLAAISAGRWETLRDYVLDRRAPIAKS